MGKQPTVFETAFDTYTVSRSEPIGQGGSGRVIAVTNTDGTHYALKYLLPEHAASPKRKRFKNEIAFCQRTDHRHVVKVVDTGTVSWSGNSVPFYVMPYYESSLRKRMLAKIDAAEVLPLFSQIMDGVEAAHLVGVFHRDLKPENILIDPEAKEAVVADFGIAHFTSDLLITSVETKAQERLANFLYAAPEQRVKGAPVDHRADIFALGLILNEMFIGEVPQGAGYRAICSVSPGHAYLDGIVERMIQQSPEARPATIDEVKREFIGHRNAFVARQELDATRAQVVRSHTPPEMAPIALTGVDWHNGEMEFILNRAPDREWAMWFVQPCAGFPYTTNCHPQRFTIRGGSAFARVDEAGAQGFVDYFKIYADLANKSYAREVAAEAAKREEAERRLLEEAVARAEKRERVLRSARL